LSYDDSLDKDRAYASQCYVKVRWYCPVCVLQKKIKKHCKIHKTPASWWWHIKNEHGKFVNRKFSFDDLRIVSNYLVKALEWEITSVSNLEEFIEKPVTTSSSFLINGKKPRIDRRKKLEKIAKLLKIQSEFYPKFRPAILKKIVRIAIGPHDYRIMEFYFDCVTYYSKKDRIRGEYDVTEYCEILGA